MPYVTLLEASQIVKNETGIDITVPQLIRAGAMQHLMLCVLLDVKCYSPTHRIRREKRALELDPDYWSNCPIDRIDDADVVDAYGLFVLPPRHVFAYQTKETVRVDSVASLDGLDIYFPGVDVSRDALQITMPHLDAFIKHIKATQATASRVEAATEPVPIGGERVAQRPEKVDFSLLATPDELITAFGAFTGMDASWFRKITDKPRLHEARRFAGTRGKGGTKPLFCPLAVMLWLIGPRKVGRTMSASKGWEMLEKHFPHVYIKYSVGDPR